VRGGFGKDFSGHASASDQMALVAREMLNARVEGPIYEYSFNGQTHRMAIIVGSNGFIVGANPTSLP